MTSTETKTSIKRILLVSHGWPLDRYGGVGLYVQMLLHELSKLNYELFLLTPELGTKFLVHRQKNFWGTHLSLEHPPINRYSQTWKWKERDESIKAIIFELMPDVIHLHHLDRLGLTVWEHISKKIPIVYTLHDYASICSRGQLYNPHSKQICSGPNPLECSSCLHIELQHNPLTNWFQKWIPTQHISHFKNLAQQTSKISFLAQFRMYQRLLQSRRLLYHVHAISPSKNLQQRLVDRGFAKPSYLELPLLQDLPMISAPQKQERKGFLFAGSLIESKGLLILLEAFETIPNQCLTIAGDGPLYDKRNEYPQHTWLGHVDHKNMLEIMMQHHTIILPSLWPENAPIVLREAAALGLQIICTSGGGEELSSQAIVVERTIEGLQKAIWNVLDDREKKKPLPKPQKMLNRTEHCKNIISLYNFCILQKSKTKTIET